MPPSAPDGLLNWPSPKPASRAGSRGPTANTICRCNFRIPGFCSSAVGILIVPTQASILSRCRAPRCDRRPVRPKRNLRKRLENNLRTSEEKIVTRYTCLGVHLDGEVLFVLFVCETGEPEDSCRIGGGGIAVELCRYGVKHRFGLVWRHSFDFPNDLELVRRSVQNVARLWHKVRLLDGS